MISYQVQHKPREQRWTENWHKYAEFLAANGRRPSSSHAREGSMAVWYKANLIRYTDDQLSEERRKSFEKLTDNGDTYKFFVANRDKTVPQLTYFGKHVNVFGRENDARLSFTDACKYYVGFCNMMERHPWLKKPLEVELAKWYLKEKDDFFNNRISAEESVIFDDLEQKTSVYRNYNVIRHVSELLDKRAEGDDDGGIYDTDGEVFQARGKDARWFEMCEKYSRYLDKNNKVPTQYGDRQLYHWIQRQRKCLKEGTLPESRHAALEKVLAKIDAIRKAEEESDEPYEKVGGRKKNSTNGKLVKQDDLWNSKWQAYMDYMNKNKRRPSKHHAEDMVLFDWYKHNKKLLNQGKLQKDRIVKFKKLLGEAKDLQRVNQYDYVNPTLKVEKAPIHLRDYQADMKKRIEEAFLKYSSVMVQMPTGTGKTHVIASVVRDFVRDGMGEVWVVAHRRELVAQIKKTLAEYLTENEMRHIRATSIQWLSKNYKNLSESPGLIVIDEAHHAIAKTYAEVMDSYPMAKKLGVTATPYRLSGAGFTDLFNVLLTSWSISTFIKKGYLCPFDYYCITKNSVEQYKVDGLKKRGADGDYQAKELNENFNQSTIISRLYEYYMKLAKGKRGFVYAISIDHAENIAKYYREHGITAVAVSSKTPDAERAKDIEDFKNGKITILCSVDLFSEGFDAPDAEFIQLARPTLSLAKYLQMVGRGLRTAKGKKTCIILDNVGLKDKFGLPSRDRNWGAYFSGGWKSRRRKKKYFDENIGLVESVLGTLIGPVDDNEMVLEASHEDILGKKKIHKEFEVVKTKYNRYGIVDKDGNEILPCEYDHIAINDDAIASAKWGEMTKFYDLLNGLWYNKLPQVGYVGSVPIVYFNHTFYPRLHSKWIDLGHGISEENMLMQFGYGLDWNNIFITWIGKPKVYHVVDVKKCHARLLRDDQGKDYVQRNPKAKPISVGYVKDVHGWFKKRKEEYKEFVQRAKSFPIEYGETDIDKLKNQNLRIWKDEAGIITVTQNDGKQYWIDSMTGRKFNKRPKTRIRGAAQLLYIDDFVFVRNLKNRKYPYLDWQISADRKTVYIENSKY